MMSGERLGPWASCFFPHPFSPRFFKAVHEQFCFVLRINGGDQAEMKMIGKKDLIPDMHCC